MQLVPSCIRCLTNRSSIFPPHHASLQALQIQISGFVLLQMQGVRHSHKFRTGKCDVRIAGMSHS